MPSLPEAMTWCYMTRVKCAYMRNVNKSNSLFICSEIPSEWAIRESASARGVFLLSLFTRTNVTRTKPVSSMSSKKTGSTFRKLLSRFQTLCLLDVQPISAGAPWSFSTNKFINPVYELPLFSAGIPLLWHFP